MKSPHLKYCRCVNVVCVSCGLFEPSSVYFVFVAILGKHLRLLSSCCQRNASVWSLFTNAERHEVETLTSMWRNM